MEAHRCGGGGTGGLTFGSELAELGVADRERGRPSTPLTGPDIALSVIVDDGGFVLRLIVSESEKAPRGPIQESL